MVVETAAEYRDLNNGGGIHVSTHCFTCRNSSHSSHQIRKLCVSANPEFSYHLQRPLSMKTTEALLLWRILNLVVKLFVLSFMPSRCIGFVLGSSQMQLKSSILNRQIKRATCSQRLYQHLSSNKIVVSLVVGNHAFERENQRKSINTEIVALYCTSRSR